MHLTTTQANGVAWPPPPKRAPPPAAQPLEPRQRREDRFEVNVWSLHKLICSSREVLAERRDTLVDLQRVARKTLRLAVVHGVGAVATGCGAVLAGVDPAALGGADHAGAASWALGGACTVLTLRGAVLWRRCLTAGRQSVDLRARQHEREIVMHQQEAAASQTLTLLARMQHGTATPNAAEVTAIGPHPPTGARTRQPVRRFEAEVTPALGVTAPSSTPAGVQPVALDQDWPSGTTYRPH